MTASITGEKALVLAVMEQAIRDYFQHMTTALDIKNKNTSANLKRDAYKWIYITDDTTDQPFSFSWCCCVLDITPKRMRKIIEKIQRNKESPTIKSGNLSNVITYLCANEQRYELYAPRAQRKPNY